MQILYALNSYIWENSGDKLQFIKLLLSTACWVTWTFLMYSVHVLFNLLVPPLLQLNKTTVACVFDR